MRESTFEQLYATHAQSLFAFLAYRAGNRVVAEDLLAETFERALRARQRFDRRRASEKTWLYAIALNCARDHARRRASEVRALERVGHEERDGTSREFDMTADPRSSAIFDAIFERDAVARALPVLSTEERESIALRFGADLSVPEIAKLTGEPLTTVEGRVYRALRKLRAAMKRSDDVQRDQAVA